MIIGIIPMSLIISNGLTSEKYKHSIDEQCMFLLFWVHLSPHSFCVPPSSFSWRPTSLSTALPLTVVAKETKNTSLLFPTEIPCLWIFVRRVERKMKSWIRKGSDCCSVSFCQQTPHEQHPGEMRTENNLVPFLCSSVPELWGQITPLCGNLDLSFSAWPQVFSEQPPQGLGDVNQSRSQHWGLSSRNQSLLETHTGRSWELLQKILYVNFIIIPVHFLPCQTPCLGTISSPPMLISNYFYMMVLLLEFLITLFN